MDTNNKTVAFISLILLKIVTNVEVTTNEIQQLENIADDLGAYELDPDEFRY